MTPTPKIQAVAAAGGLATALIFIAQLAGLEVPEQLAVPATALLTFAFGWLRGEHDEPGAHAAS